MTEPIREVVPLRGIADGARVTGTLFAVLTLVALTGALLTYGFSFGMIPLVAYGLFVGVRPWFMGATLSGTTLEIRSWYRLDRIGLGEVASVELSPYNARGEVRRLPFIGQVRIVALVMESGSSKDYPATLGRQSRVRAIATEIVTYAGSVGSGARLGESYFD